MKIYKRILSTLLAVIMMFGSVSALIFGVGAEEETEDKNEEIDIESVYVKTVYNTPEDRLYGENSKMQLMLERNGYQLYVDKISGEVATVEVATGQILFSNPYDTASSKGSDSTKKQILSQVIVQYVDNGTTKYLYSFEEAAMREQIAVLNIKNGVRVEYTIGREESRKLVPRWISETNYQKFIDDPLEAAVEAGEIDEFYYTKFTTYYSLQALSQKKSKKAKEQLLISYPICEKMDIRTFSIEASAKEINWCESYIKTYCEDYTFEQMDADHEETGYEATDEQYPVFKMALEYSLDENGLTVRMPCNGLRYDMSTYTLEYISILPYMGAGNSKNPGYNFFPDGAGSLFDFEKLDTKSTTTVRGKVYGLDYAYHTINVGSAYQKAIRYPVYGSVASEKYYTFTYSKPEINDKKEEVMTSETLTVSHTVMDKEKINEFIKKQDGYLTSEIEEETFNRGYVAIIESGESLAEISTYHAGALSDFNTMINYFNPKPKDSYDIADAISVTTSSTWTVVSDRKFTGSIKIRYRMLIDEEDAAQAKEENSNYTYYETTWLGMAEAYRDYLITNGTLKKLTDDQIEDNIPLYLEVFGTLETLQTFMTIPVNEMTPLTTFENIMEMYEELSEAGIKNINFKMTGFANGGMYSTIPSGLKWESAVGGKSGLEELVKKAQEINADSTQHIGLYPDFDFAYAQTNELFDSLNLKDDAVKTIDNRYSSKRQYSATQQSYVSFFELAISPSRYSKFYEKLLKKYEKTGLTGMSVSSLGTALNSDFDEDDPYNREDSKDFTVQAFEDLKAAGYSLMTDGANAYSWAYVDHILNVDLDSSRYVKSSASVPFIGAVLHGYVQFAGTPLNEEGDTNYAILRAIENGAGLYFILSYQNTAELKEDLLLSQYYSVRYDIWKEDVVKYYNELNEQLKDVQNKIIIDHRFLVGERVLDLDELQAELEEQLKNAAEEEKKKQEAIETDKVLEVANAWQIAESAKSKFNALLDEMKLINDEEIIYSYKLLSYNAKNLGNFVDPVLSFHNDGNIEEMQSQYDAACSSLQSQITSLKTMAANILKSYQKLDLVYAEVEQLIEDVRAAKVAVENAATLDASVRDAMVAEMQGYLDEVEQMLPLAIAELTRSEDDEAITKEKAIETAVNAQVDYLVAKGDFKHLQKELDAVVADFLFTAADVEKAGVLEEEFESTEGDDDDDQKKDKYVVDNNQIVVVTYGDRNDATHQKTAYKSFILNYNNFAVKVDYDGVTYTIPSGEYVVLYH